MLESSCRRLNNIAKVEGLEDTFQFNTITSMSEHIRVEVNGNNNVSACHPNFIQNLVEINKD